MGPAVKLAGLHVKGFKCFAGQVQLDGIHPDFTCIVGPNGCGKSVLCEAVAFVLGGNKRMLRASNLAVLVNQDVASSSSTAPGPLVEVTLKLQVLAELEAEGHAPESKPSSPISMLHIRRQLMAPGTRSETHVMLCNEAGAMRGSWRQVSQEELHDLLLPLGINTTVVDRYVVTQSRQAVAVGNPVALVHHIEVLLGSYHLAEKIDAADSQLRSLNQECGQLEDEMYRLQERRQQLAPAVQKWRSYCAEFETMRTRKLAALKLACSSFSCAVEAAEQQAAEAEAALQDHNASLQITRAEHTGAQKEHAAALASLQSSTCAVQDVRNKLERLSSETAKLQAQETACINAEKRAKKLVKSSTVAAAQAQDCQEQLEHARKAVDVEAQALQALQQQVKQLKKRLALSDMAQPPAVQGAQAALNAAQTTLSGLHLQLRAQQQAADQAQARVQGLQALAARTDASVTTLQDKLRSQQEALGNTEADVKRLQASCMEAASVLEQTHKQHIEAQVQAQIAAVMHKELLQRGASAAGGPGQLCPASAADLFEGLPVSSAGLNPFDRALTELWQQSQAGLIPGHFLGRLHSVAIVSDPADCQPVNAALAQIANLGSWVVVSERATALAAVAHFTSQRVGIVTCRVLSECGHPSRPSAADQEATAQAWSKASGVALTPLRSLITPAPHVPEVGPLLDSITTGWYVVDTQDAALAVLQVSQAADQAARRPSLVTRSGEVFKSDGEIVAQVRQQQRSRQHAGASAAAEYIPGPYDLGTEPVALADTHDTTEDGVQGGAGGSRSVAGGRGHKQRGVAISKARDAGADEAAAAKQAALREASERAAALEANVRQLSTKLTEQQRQHMEAHAAVKQLQSKHTLNARAVASTLSKIAAAQRASDAARAKAQSQLTAAQAALAAARAGGADLAQQVEEAQHRCDRLMSELEAAQASASLGASQQAASAEAVRAQLKEAAQQVEEHKLAKQQATEALRSCKAEADCAAAVHQQLEQELAAVRNKSRAEQLHAMRRQLQAAKKQLVEGEAEMQGLQQTVEAASLRVTELGKRVDTTSAVLDAATATAATARDEHKRAHQHLTSLHSQLQEHQNSLQQLRADLAAAAVACGGKAGMAASSETGIVHAADGAGAQLNGAGVPVSTPVRLRPAATEAPPSSAAVSGALRAMVSAVSEKGGRRAMGAGPGSSMRKAARRGSGKRRAVCSSSCDDECEDDSAKESGDDEAGQGAGGEVIGSGGESDEGPQRSHVSRTTRGSVRRTQAAQGAKVKSSGKSKGTAVVLGQVVRELQEVGAEEARLVQERASIHEAALEEDLAAVQRCVDIKGQLSDVAVRISHVTALREALLEERFSLLKGALATVNSKFSQVYRFLTGDQGDSQLSYTLERRLLFVHGITVNIRPDLHHWRAFSALSGGQQALACLALSFALQATQPSPFYLFDEVDSALDSSAASRVAQYIAQGGVFRTGGVMKGAAGEAAGAATTGQGGAAKRARAEAGSTGSTAGPGSSTAGQYIVVSHRPQVFERAPCLVGVYMLRGTSHAVLAHIQPGSLA